MGNFSKDPDIAFQDALERGYSRLLFQQGKPVLDRELNLLADLASFRQLAPYLGNGVPAGDNGFAVSGLNVPANDFDITAGRCLIDGHEVRLAANITYQTQPHTPNAPLPEGKSNVYLRISPVKVNAELDADLGNSGAENVGFETSIREKTDWKIVVSKEEIDESNHFLLAEIDTTNNEVVDRRRQTLTLAALRDELDRERGSVAELSQRLDTSLLPDGKLRDAAVAEPILADNAVSTRTIADGAVPIQKLRSTVVFDSDVDVPASPGPGQVGERKVNLLIADTHAFLLVSVHYKSPRPLSSNQPFEFIVDWKHRVTAFSHPGSLRYDHLHQIVLSQLHSNTRTGPITVGCKAYILNET